MPDWVAAGTVPELRTFFVPVIPVSARPTLSASAHAAKPTRPRTSPPAPARSVFTGKNLLVAMGVLLALGAEVASRTKPDAEEPEKTELPAAAPEPEEPEEEIKEIGYAAKHMHDEAADGSSETSTEINPTTSEPVQEDAIESIDNDNGGLTVHYERSSPRGFNVGKDPFFAYSPHFIVTHNDRVSCQVWDIYGNRLTSGFTNNGSSACTGMRVVGDQIIIDVDTGHSTHQETYDTNLRLLRTSPSHMY